MNGQPGDVHIERKAFDRGFAEQILQAGAGGPGIYFARIIKARKVLAAGKHIVAQIEGRTIGNRYIPQLRAIFKQVVPEINFFCTERYICQIWKIVKHIAGNGNGIAGNRQRLKVGAVRKRLASKRDIPAADMNVSNACRTLIFNRQIACHLQIKRFYLRIV